MLSGYFGQRQAGGRPRALGLQRSISASDKLWEVLGDSGSPLPAMGMITFVSWRLRLALLTPRAGLNTSIFPGRLGSQGLGDTKGKGWGFYQSYDRTTSGWVARNRVVQHQWLFLSTWPAPLWSVLGCTALGVNTPSQQKLKWKVRL